MPIRPIALFLAFACISTVTCPPPARADESEETRKSFKKRIRSKDVDVRRKAWFDLAYAEGPETVELGLKSLKNETSEVVILAAIDVLGAFRGKESRDPLREAAAKGRGEMSLFALLALGVDPTSEDIALLTELIEAKDDMVACQAALTLARAGDTAVRDKLIGLLAHKSHHRRIAAARGLTTMATPGARPKDAPKVDAKPALAPLVKALAKAEGRERSDHIMALEAISGQRFGADRAAWEQLVGGTAADKIEPRQIEEPYIFGIPIRGERVVLVLSNSQRNENPVPFDVERLKELCQVPGAFPIVHSRLRTVGQFSKAHATRLIEDLPKGTRFELILFHELVQPLLGKLTSLNRGTQSKLATALEEAKPDARMNHYGALMAALDIAGTKDSAAMKSGPDEIIFVACNVPNFGEVSEPNQVAAAVALKARRRMVTIHTIGIETHAYEMMRTIAQQTGGTYLDLHK